MNSRFVNLLVKNMNGRCMSFSLHRINPANLFYPTGSPAPKGSADPAIMEDAPLPPARISFDWPARISFDWPCLQGHLGGMDFMAFGRSRNNIIAVDPMGCTFLYDAALRTLRTRMPMLRKRIWKPISITVGDSLYVMSGNPSSRLPLTTRHCFLALRCYDDDWYWKSLQPPPFDDYASCYDEDEDEEEEDVQDPFEIGAYTVVGDSQIWISTVGAGTYSFDTASGAWNKAGEWALPFRGRAEYAPEHNLWFGFEHKDEQLCVSDLTAVSAVRPPVPQNVWKDLARPKDWTLRSTHLLPLGSSKLCVARFFLTSEKNFREEVSGCTPDIVEFFVVLTGVEVVKADGIGSLRMIQHKSKRYSFGPNLVHPL